MSSRNSSENITILSKKTQLIYAVDTKKEEIFFISFHEIKGGNTLPINFWLDNPSLCDNSLLFI